MLKLKMYYRWVTNYLLARISHFSTYALSPRILSIETTERCNLDCIMCPRKQTSLSKREFTLEQFKHVLSLFPRVNTVILLGRGETFMMRDIFPILDFGSRKGIQFTIITNGTMLTAETVKKIPDVGKIVISIDHPHPDRYREIRRGGDLNGIVTNLSLLKKLKPSQWVCIQVVLMNNNIDYLEDFIRLAKSVSANGIKFILPVVFDSKMNGIYPGSSDQVSLKLDRARAYAKKERIRFIAVPQMKKPRICVEPWIGLRISLAGDIYPCCYINNSSEAFWCEWLKNVSLSVPQANYIMGNIYDKSVSGIWNGEEFRCLRRKIIRTNRKTLITSEDLNALRVGIDGSKRFSYCAVCLYRLNKAC